MYVQGKEWEGRNRCNLESVGGSNTLSQSLSIKMEKSWQSRAAKLKLKLMGIISRGGWGGLSHSAPFVYLCTYTGQMYECTQTEHD